MLRELRIAAVQYVSKLEDVENVRVGWPGGALSLRILASDRSLGIGHWAL